MRIVRHARTHRTRCTYASYGAVSSERPFCTAKAPFRFAIRGNLHRRSQSSTFQFLSSSFHISIFQSSNFNVAALTGRRNGRMCNVSQGSALGCMQLRFQRAFVAVSILPYFNLSVFVAYAATVCAPEGQLPLAQGSALGICVGRKNAPCKGNCFPQKRGCSVLATTFCHINATPMIAYLWCFALSFV
jgi:hypothetical protein